MEDGSSGRARLFLFCILSVLFALGCSVERSEPVEDSVRATTLEATTPISLSMPVPKGRQLKQFGLIGLDGVTLEDRARTERVDGGFAAIANTRSGQVTVGADAHSGSILAVGNALLRDRATVHGSLTLGGQRLNQSVWTVEGEQQTGVPLATEPLNLVFQQPTTAQPLPSGSSLAKRARHLCRPVATRASISRVGPRSLSRRANTSLEA